MKKLSFVFLLAVMLLSACSPATVVPTAEPLPTNTEVPPMDTPIPPTETPITLTDTPAPPTETPEPTATPKPPELRGKFDVGGYELYIKCKGEGGPTIVLDAGLTQGLKEWTSIMTQLNTELGVMVCGYNRLGISSSDPLLDEPRTNQDMAEDLYALLHAAEIPGPYVYVGHSLSGFTGRLFATQYADEVAGMVLVDPTHPDYHPTALALLPEESDDEAAEIAAIRYWYDTRYNDPTRMSAFLEHWDMASSAEQVRASGSLGDLPLVVLMRDMNAVEAQNKFDAFFFSDGSWFGDEFPTLWTGKLNSLWEPLMVETTALSTNSQLIVAEGSSHMIPDENPQSVVDAVGLVLEMIEAAGN